MISLIIALINLVISVLIALSTNFEGNYTATGHQTSLAIKSIFAQLINSILVPVLVNYVLENQNIYGKNGLSTDIIYLSITNSLLNPLIRIIDPKYRFEKIAAYYYRTTAIEKIQLKQG